MKIPRKINNFINLTGETSIGIISGIAKQSAYKIKVQKSKTFQILSQNETIPKPIIFKAFSRT